MPPVAHDLLVLIINILNDIIIVYFVVGNGTYTVLMLISFVSVWGYQRRIVYASIQEVRESPVTPPVSVIVPAYNEESSILLTVESLLALDYPDKRRSWWSTTVRPTKRWPT